MDRPDGGLIPIDGEPYPKDCAGAEGDLCYDVEHNGSPEPTSEIPSVGFPGDKTTLPTANENL
jgi:hypothetical protein